MAIPRGQSVCTPSGDYFRLCGLTVSPEYDLDTDTVRAMSVVTNTFCAGGGVTADGTWVNLGGKLTPTSATAIHCLDVAAELAFA